MHKNIHHGAHECLWDMELEREESRRVALLSLVLVWSPRSYARSERAYTGQVRKAAKIACIGMWPRVHFLDLQQLDHWCNSCLDNTRVNF